MRPLLLMLLLVCGACSANPPDDGAPPDADAAPDASTNADADVDADTDTMLDVGRDAADGDPIPTTPVQIVLGRRELPFQPWTADDDVIVVEGPQGGFHTEHAARVDGATTSALHLAIIYAEMWRDDLVLARTGWEFWQEQWEVSDDGLRVELPALIFDEQPDLGPAELRAELELTDGRTARFAVGVILVQAP